MISPPDLEQDIEAQVEAVATENDTIKALADFPPDDVVVRIDLAALLNFSAMTIDVTMLG